MSKAIFRFKQFSVRQDQCAMKVGTDGFLLGALTAFPQAERILDIGTGTGLVALLLAQQSQARIDAIELDPAAAQQAELNFKESPWANRLSIHQQAFEAFESEEHYDLIVSNPPYFIQAYTSPDQQRNKARHAAADFLGDWMYKIKGLLTEKGSVSFIVPYDVYAKIVSHANAVDLYLQLCISIKSFEHDLPKRVIVVFGKQKQGLVEQDFVIYEAVNSYTEAYKVLAKPFFLYF